MYVRNIIISVEFMKISSRLPYPSHDRILLIFTMFHVKHNSVDAF